MDNKIQYKVLWVDDNDSIVDETQGVAELYDLLLDRYSNWEDAECALKKDFGGYSAIILDVNCKMSKTSFEEIGFINKILPRMHMIFGERQKHIPWYFLSAGTMSGFDRVIEEAQSTRKMLDPDNEWGEMVYKKNLPEDEPQSSDNLFKKVREVAKKQLNNVVLYRHKDVFELVGEGKLIDSSEARTYLLDMFGALYYPEKYKNFEYNGNSLRKVLEYFFQAVNKCGFLPEECINSNDFLANSCRFMSGEEVNLKEVKLSSAEAIFSEDIKYMVRTLQAYVNRKSHTNFQKKEIHYLTGENAKEEFFGYLFHLCYLIKWFGKYAEVHKNYEENRKKIIRKSAVKKDESSTQKSPEDIEGKEYVILSGDSGPYCGSYNKFSSELESKLKTKIGENILIKKAIFNEKRDKEKFPFIITEIELL